jgi:capsid protein
VCTGAEALLAAKIAAALAGTAASAKSMLAKPKPNVGATGGRLFPDLAGMALPDFTVGMGTPPFNPNAPDPRVGAFGGGTAAEDWRARMMNALGY